MASTSNQNGNNKSKQSNENTTKSKSHTLQQVLDDDLKSDNESSDKKWPDRSFIDGSDLDYEVNIDEPQLVPDPEPCFKDNLLVLNVSIVLLISFCIV